MTGLLPVVGYDIPLPYTNGGERGMADVVESLLTLQKTCDDVLGNINNRVELLRDCFQDLHDRALDCKDRVESLKGVKKALVVLSAPNLPKDTQEEETHCVHNNTKRKRMALDKKIGAMPLPFKAPIDVSISGDGAEKKTTATKPFDPAEKFEFSLLMPPRSNEQLSRATERGLGRLPRHLESITSLLLFNTRENVYREYNDINVFSLMRQERVDGQNRRRPDGTFREDFSMKIGADEYMFRPEMDGEHNLLDDLTNDLPFEDAAIPLGWDEQLADPMDTIAPTGQGRRRGDGETESASEGIRPSPKSANANASGLPPSMMAASTPSPMGTTAPPPPPGMAGGSSVPPPPPGIAPNMGGGVPMPRGFAGAGGGSTAPPPPAMGGFPGTASMPAPSGLGGGGSVPAPPGMSAPPKTAMPPPPTGVAPTAAAATPAPAAAARPAGMADLLASIRGAGASALNKTAGPATSQEKPQAAAGKSALAKAMQARQRAIAGDMSDDDDASSSSKPKPAPKPTSSSSAAATSSSAPSPAPKPAGVPPPPPPGQKQPAASAPANMPPPVPKGPPPNPFAKKSVKKAASDDDW